MRSNHLINANHYRFGHWKEFLQREIKKEPISHGSSHD